MNARTRRWCIFTSAGNVNSIDCWLTPQRDVKWDLIIAFYGNDENEYDRLKGISSLIFRTNGSKFQNLKKLVTEQKNILDQYSYVWVCDDDIKMSADHIERMFAFTQMFEFWVSQPAFSPRGKYSHEITVCAGRKADYRIVNFVEVTAPIFRRDKLIEFLSVYDGSLVGFGIDYWYMNYFNANECGRFAIVDSVQVVNPTDREKRGREIDRLQTFDERMAAWGIVKDKFGLVGYSHKVFAYCKITGVADSGRLSLARRLFVITAKVKTRLKFLVSGG